MVSRSKVVPLAIFVLLSVIARPIVDASVIEDWQRLGGNNNFNDLDPVWSPDGRHILFLSDRAGDWDIWLMEPDGTNQVNLTADFSGLTGEASWSPDGSQIIFSSDRTGNNDIWVMEADGANPINLTPEMSHDEGEPVWSPDGQFIAFVSTQSGTYSVWVMSAENGGEKRQISPVDQQSYLVPGWLSDSRTVIFEGGTKESFQIWRAAIDGSLAVPLAGDIPYRAANTQICAANDRIVFTNLAENVLGEIWIMNADGSGLTNLTPNAQGSSPVWSPDGRFIAFRSLRAGETDIWIMESDGSNPVNLTKDIGGSSTSPHWSPDGAQLVFSAYVNGDLDVWIVNSAGRNSKNLTGNR